MVTTNVRVVREREGVCERRIRVRDQIPPYPSRHFLGVGEEGGNRSITLIFSPGEIRSKIW